MNTASKMNLDDWAAELVAVARTAAVVLTDAEVSDMCHTDGHYMSANEAASIREAFDVADGYASFESFEKVTFLHKEGNIDRAILFCDPDFDDEDVAGMVCIYFYDEATY